MFFLFLLCISQVWMVHYHQRLWSRVSRMAGSWGCRILNSIYSQTLGYTESSICWRTRWKDSDTRSWNEWIWNIGRISLETCVDENMSGKCLGNPLKEFPKHQMTHRDVERKPVGQLNLVIIQVLTIAMSQCVSLRWRLQKTRMFLSSFNSSIDRTNFPNWQCLGEISPKHEIILQYRTLQKTCCLQDSMAK